MGKTHAYEGRKEPEFGEAKEYKRYPEFGEAEPRTFRVVLGVDLLKDYASIEDFEREIDMFNRANEGVIQVTVSEITHKGKRIL